MKDQFGRTIDYMRISVTDRCNLRCRYCMPEGIETVAMKDILTYEEIAEITAAAAELGIRKIKITGGEPLVRPQCHKLIAMLKQIDGIEQVTMTTNGILLEKHLHELNEAGLDGVNVSLDTLRKERFASITGRDELDQVLSSLKAALNTGMRVKINAVLQKGVNEDEWLELAKLAEANALDVRFIEMMPIGFGQMSQGISNETLLAQLKELYPDIEADHRVHGNGPAVYMHIPGWHGSIGLISAIHGKFCASCNRIRLTSQGKIKPCLCYGASADLKDALRNIPDQKKRHETLKEILKDAVYHKPLQHSFENAEAITEKDSMVRIGG